MEAINVSETRTLLGSVGRTKRSISSTWHKICEKIFGIILSIRTRARAELVLLIFVFAHVLLRCTVPHVIIQTLCWGFSANAFWLSGRFLPSDQEIQRCAGDCDMKIPKIIHQTYKTTELPERWMDTPIEWTGLHRGWEYKFWTNEDNRKLIEDHYPWFLEQYDSYEFPIMRADVARYFILHHYGGVYADLDIRPTRNIEELLQNEQIVLFETPNLGLTNSLMASVPGHRFWEYVHDDLGYMRHNVLFRFSNYGKIITSTGSALLWHAYQSWDDPKKYEEIALLDSGRYGKSNWCQTQKPDWFKRRTSGQSWFHHIEGSSWHPSANSVSYVKMGTCAPIPFLMVVIGTIAILAVIYWLLLAIVYKKVWPFQLLCNKDAFSFAACFCATCVILFYFT